MAVTEADVAACLRAGVVDPNTGKDFVAREGDQEDQRRRRRRHASTSQLGYPAQEPARDC